MSLEAALPGGGASPKPEGRRSKHLAVCHQPKAEGRSLNGFPRGFHGPTACANGRAELDSEQRTGTLRGGGNVKNIVPGQLYRTTEGLKQDVICPRATQTGGLRYGRLQVCVTSDGGSLQAKA